MAILPSRPGIKISVICNGAPLQEYEDDDADDQDGTVISNYIEAVSGAEFAVQWEVTSPWPPYTILFEYWLDQKKVSGKYCKPVYFQHPAYVYLEEGASTVVDGQTYLHKFAFAALTVDDNSASHLQDQLMKDLKGIGEITVKAWFVKNLLTTVTANRALDNSLKEVGKIPEKALKGRTLSHQTSLRTPQLSGRKTSTASCEFVDPAKQPFAMYTFKHRSRDALKSLLIIPRSPSPVPLEEREVDTLSAEEIRELLRRQRERDAEARSVKRERGIKREYARERSGTILDDGDDEISIVSSKRRRENYRTIVEENGIEAIDLT